MKQSRGSKLRITLEKLPAYQQERGKYLIRAIKTIERLLRLGRLFSPLFLLIALMYMLRYWRPEDLTVWLWSMAVVSVLLLGVLWLAVLGKISLVCDRIIRKSRTDDHFLVVLETFASANWIARMLYEKLKDEKNRQPDQ